MIDELRSQLEALGLRKGVIRCSDLRSSGQFVEFVVEKRLANRLLLMFPALSNGMHLAFFKTEFSRSPKPIARGTCRVDRSATEASYSLRRPKRFFINYPCTTRVWLTATGDASVRETIPAEVPIGNGVKFIFRVGAIYRPRRHTHSIRG
ncbi:MAG TPA: hypothetical protein V6D29_03820 [Leptolyngbyaceae cyanobacterium]